MYEKGKNALLAKTVKIYQASTVSIGHIGYLKGRGGFRLVLGIDHAPRQSPVVFWAPLPALKRALILFEGGVRQGSGGAHRGWIVHAHRTLEAALVILSPVSA